VLCARTTLPSETIDARMIGGAGGPDHSVGDFFFSDRRMMATEDGAWGILSVCATASNCGIEKVS
jgi:hypothetical protein